MASPKAAAALLVLSLASSAAAFKFNVTEILSEFPEFSTFNSLLSQTKLADEINRRQTITVLVVDDSAASAITSLPADTQRKVLAVQVILDYYDPVKLDGIKDKTALLTTLFQATGAATDRMGFVNYTQGADDQMAFGSAEPGAPLSSQLVKVVASRPYNISVMQVSAAIVPPSIGSSGPAKAKGSSPSPAPSNKAEHPEASTPTTKADAPEPSDDANAPAAHTPSLAADGPEAGDAPASSLPEKRADAAADARTSAGSRVVVGASVGLMGLVALMVSI